MTKPIFSAIAAVSLDGKIAAYENQHSDWTSQEDKVFLRQMLDDSDAVLVGRKTYEIAIQPLSKRKCIVLTRGVSGFLDENPNLIFCNPETRDLLQLCLVRGYGKVAVLGGAETYSWCLRGGLLDEIFLTIEPVIFGQGLNLFQLDAAANNHAKLVAVKELNGSGTVLLRYKITKTSKN